MKNVPIRRIAFTTPAAERERLVDKGRRLYEQFCQKEDYACVLGFVEHHLRGGERPDAKASGYTNEGHLRGLGHAAREGGLHPEGTWGSPPIHGSGDHGVTPHDNAAAPYANVTQPHVNTTEPHTNTLADVSTAPAQHTNITQRHANAPVQHADVTEPRAETPVQHANVMEHRANVAVHHANIMEHRANATAPQAIVAPAPDIVHDLLAFLAQQMIVLHKQRQQAGEAFVLDLEGVLDTGAVDKLGRLWTPPKATDAAASAEAHSVLGSLAQRRITLRDDAGALNEAQWKWLTKRRLKQVPNFAQVVQVFRDHQPTLAALDQQIAATDRLIDQIVYRLYGLTGAEIALVEGGAVVPGP